MRFVLGIEYEGTHYHGFQRQKKWITVQGVLEEALSKVAAHPIQVVCAGRTDAGVHALAQVVHFDTHAQRPDKAWVLGVNAYMMPDVRVQWVKKVDEQFSARFSALSRTYEYVIENQAARPALMRHLVTWYPFYLDEAAMQEAAQYLVGEHDFSAFRSSHCQALTPFRRIIELNVRREKQRIIITLCANAFLHNMVRNIVGVLVEIGTGKKPPIWCYEVLQSRKRERGAVKMPPMGLCLVKVEYPEHFGLTL